MRSNKICLRLTKGQTSQCWWFSKVSRNFWNLLVFLDRENGKGTFDSFLKDKGLATYYSNYHKRDVYKLTQTMYRRLASYYILNLSTKEQETFSWFFQDNQSFIYSSVIREFLNIRFRNKGKVNYREISKTTPSFPVRCDVSANKKRPSRIYLKDDGRLQIPSLGEVKFGSVREGYDLSGKKQTAKVLFDGKYWYLTYSEEVDTTIENLPDFTDGIGIDLGLRNLATLSDGTIIPSIRNQRRVWILEKRLKRLQRKVAYKYRVNKCDKHNKTKNIRKLERQIRLIHRTLKNIRVNYIREFVANILKKQPMYLALEDLNVRAMYKDKHLREALAFASFYSIRQHLTRKAKERQIAVRLVDRYFPSSKTCSSCGEVKKNLALKERTYHCHKCDLLVDRDLNAAYNLATADKYVLV